MHCFTYSVDLQYILYYLKSNRSFMHTKHTSLHTILLLAIWQRYTQELKAPSYHYKYSYALLEMRA